MTDKRLIDGEWDLHPGAAPSDLSAKAPKVSYPPTIVDAERYYSRETMESEWEHLWTKVWTVAGLVSDLAKPGDYITYELGRETFIIVRASPTEIKAFYNVCSHRANPLVFNEKGHVLTFTCGFHSWQYDLNGNLIKITDEELFPEQVICPRPGLHEVRLDTWGGFVFINMDDDAEDLKDFLGIVPEHLAGYHMENFFVFSDVQMEWEANWKTAIDGFLELYHSHAVHPQALGLWEDKYVQYDCYPRGHSRMIVPWGVTSSRKKNSAELTQPLRDQLANVGVDVDEYSGPAHDIRETLVAAKRRKAETLGLEYYKELTDDQLREAWSYSIFPNWTINIQDNAFLYQSWRPHRRDPEKLIYHTMTFLPRVDPSRLPQADSRPPADGGPKDVPKPGLSASIDAARLVDPSVRPARIHATMESELGPVLKQDFLQASRPQRGLRSRAFAGMRLGGEEVRIRHYLAEIYTYLEPEQATDADFGSAGHRPGRAVSRDQRKASAHG